MTDQNDGKWHLDKRFSIGHIVTTLTVIIAAVSWGIGLEQAILSNSKDIHYLQEQRRADQSFVVQIKDEIRQELRDLKNDQKETNRKLDQLLRYQLRRARDQPDS